MPGDDLTVRAGDHVRISLRNNPARNSEGVVFRILSDADPSKILVVLRSGDSGTVTGVVNSAQHMERRIMAEGQHCENKENFGEPVMRDDVIPKTVQSFLNSEGGYLYVGIRDTGGIRERLAGLEYDLDLIREERGQEQTDKLCDMLELRIMSALEKHLVSDAALGPLVTVSFPRIRGVVIVEIAMKKSPHPWFYRHMTKKNKAKQFQILDGEEPAGSRALDDFYIRQGNSKKRLDTMREFYEYAKTRFKY